MTMWPTGTKWWKFKEILTIVMVVAIIVLAAIIMLGNFSQLTVAILCGVELLIIVGVAKLEEFTFRLPLGSFANQIGNRSNFQISFL